VSDARQPSFCVGGLVLTPVPLAGELLRFASEHGAARFPRPADDTTSLKPRSPGYATAFVA
jgi:hypothetical protein